MKTSNWSWLLITAPDVSIRFFVAASIRGRMYGSNVVRTYERFRHDIISQWVDIPGEERREHTKT